MSEEGKLLKQIEQSRIDHLGVVNLADIETAIDEAWRDIQTKAKSFIVLVEETSKKYPNSWNQTQVKIENEKWVRLSDVAMWLKEAT